MIMKKHFSFGLLCLGIFSILCFALAFADGTKYIWNCSECGRTGLSEKYDYCGSCGCPAPWKKFSINEVEYSGNGKVKISWDGGMSPVDVIVYHYFNGNQNNGITKCYMIHGWYGDQQYSKGVIYGIVPGQQYWIKLIDSQGKEMWRYYSAPESTASDSTIKLIGLNHVKRSNNRWITLPNVTSQNLETEFQNSYANNSEPEQIFMAAKLNIQGLSNPSQLSFFGALILPENGDVIPCEFGLEETIEKNGNLTQYIAIPWNEIYGAYGRIPTGTYTFIIGENDRIIDARNFKLAGKNNNTQKTGGQAAGMPEEKKENTTTAPNNTSQSPTNNSNSDLTEDTEPKQNDRSQEIKEYIMDDSPDKQYDQNLDVNSDGQINTMDYIVEKNNGETTDNAISE